MSLPNSILSKSTASAQADLPSLAKRFGVLGYGVVSYVIGVTALVVWILMMLGLISFSGGPIGELATGPALGLDVALLVGFGLQHSLMARPAWKARWQRVVGPALERPTYMLATGLVLLLVLWLWQPMPTTIWSFGNRVAIGGAYALAVSAWAYLFIASFAIDHFELFGLRQVWSFFVGRPIMPVEFRERWMYRIDRHPIMTGALLGMWVTPTMTAGHLVFAIGFSLYIIVGVFFEERSMLAQWGDRYEDYRDRVGAIVPRLPRGRRRADRAEGSVA
jgi:protein-S-isoprenylcysteine O-methyltransferase Ste14